MKKTNNKYRNNNNNNNNQIYSLNYKFDSNSIAGKVSGTALDLIKKYNELAKEAHGNNNYVEMEVFRQYAEHYRKIVTDINEKKSQNQSQNQRPQNFKKESSENTENAPIAENENAVSNDNGAVAAEETPKAANEAAPVAENNNEEKAVSAKRAFKVIEISAADADADNVEKVELNQPKVKRVYRKKAAAAAV